METIYNLIESQALAVTLVLLAVLLSWEGVHPFFHFFTGHARERGVHAFRNLTLGIINSLMISAVFISLWLWAAEWAEARSFGLLYLGRLPDWVQAVGAVLLLSDVPDRQNKLVYFTGINNARFRRPVVPGDVLRLELTVTHLRRQACRMHGLATVDGERAAEADIMSAMVDRQA